MTLEAQLEKIATDLFTDQTEREAFVGGFMKQAAESLIDTNVELEKSAFVDLASMGKGAGAALGGLGVGLLGAALAKGINTAVGSMDAGQTRRKFEAALAQVLATDKICKGDPERAKQYAETVYRFGPHVAGDPHLLASLLSNTVQGSSMDPMTIKSVVELEKTHTGNQVPSSFGRF